MTRGEKWLQHAANALVGGSGLAYAWTLYVAEPEDPFALVNHPWQPGLRAAHVVLAPLLVWGLAAIWRDHVWRRARGGFRPRRKSGLALAVLALPMIASGYLRQVATGEVATEIWIGLHLASSSIWLAAYLVHQLTPRRS